MKLQYINYNGEIFPADHPVITVANRSFRYGDGLFESMRWMKSKIMFSDLHAERLRKGMKMLKLEGYSHMDSYFLRQKAEELAHRNKTGPSARIRFTVFRDAEGLYAPLSNKPAYVLEVDKINEANYGLNRKGFIVDVFDEVAKPVFALSNYKTCNSLVYVLAGVFKNQHALDDVLLINQNGFLCEGMSSNLFVVYDKQIYTPALNEGCIAGVMRSVVIKLAKQNDMVITEAQISPEILNEADEVFLTNASRGIQWVMGYNKKRYFNEISKFLTAELNKL